MLPSDLTTPLRTWARPPLALIGLAIAAIDGCQVGSVGSAKAADVGPRAGRGRLAVLDRSRVLVRHLVGDRDIRSDGWMLRLLAGLSVDHDGPAGRDSLGHRVGGYGVSGAGRHRLTGRQHLLSHVRRVQGRGPDIRWAIRGPERAEHLQNHRFGGEVHREPDVERIHGEHRRVRAPSGLQVVHLRKAPVIRAFGSASLYQAVMRQHPGGSACGEP